MTKNKITDFIAENYTNKKVKWSYTSGTTGQSLKFPLSMKCFQREHAFRQLHYSWGGISEDDKIAVCAGHPVAFIERSRPPFWFIWWYCSKPGDCIMRSYFRYA